MLMTPAAVPPAAPSTVLPGRGNVAANAPRPHVGPDRTRQSDPARTHWMTGVLHSPIRCAALGCGRDGSNASHVTCPPGRRARAAHLLRADGLSPPVS